MLTFDVINDGTNGDIYWDTQHRVDGWSPIPWHPYCFQSTFYFFISPCTHSVKNGTNAQI